MVRRLVFMSAFITQSILSYGAAYADPFDKCSDILNDGTMEKTSIKTNDYLQYIMLYRMAKMNYEQARSDKTLNASGVLGPIRGDVKADESQFQIRKESLSRQFDQSLTISQQRDIALASGDQAIVAAWTDCMKSRGGGGLGVRFIPNNKNSVFMIIQWFTPPGSAQNKVVLAEDIKLPDDIDIEKSDVEHLKKGTEISNEGSRVSHLYLRNARSTATIVVRALDEQRRVQDAYAYLPPRLRFQTSRKPYFLPVDGSDRAFSYVGSVNNEKGELKFLPISIDPTKNDGWRFDPSSARQIVYTTKTQPVPGSRCDDRGAIVTSYSAHFQVYANTNNSGTVECTAFPQVDLIREEFVDNNESMVSSKDPAQKQIRASERQ